MTGALLLLFAALMSGVAPASVGDCQEQVRARPDDFEAYRCFWMIARQTRSWDEAVRALEGLVAVNPDDHRARLYLGAIAADLGQARAETLYREAASGFAAEGSARGEVYARLALAYYVRRAGRPADAVPEIDAALRAAERSEQPELVGRARFGQALQAMAEADYGQALSFLREAEEVAFPSGPFDLRTQILSARGKACWSLGLHERALETYGREAELHRSAGDSFAEAAPRYNMALMAREIALAGRLESEEYRSILDQAVAAAQRVGHRYLEVRSRLLLGQELDGQRGIEEFRRALAIALEIGDQPSARAVKQRIAEVLWRERAASRAEIYGLVDEAIEEARLAGDLQDTVRGLSVRAWVSGGTEDRDLWIEDYEKTLDAVEKIRDLQPEGTVRARVFSQWTFPYYRFAGRLLAGLPTSPDPDGDLERALRTVERMRARVLLDELDAAGAGGSPDPDDPSHAARIEVLERISALQRQLTDGSLPAEKRPPLLEDLERLEAEESALRDAIAREDPAFGRLRAPELPRLSEIRELLAADQALLSFQLSTRAITPRNSVDNGGSWLTVVTGEEARAFPLPDEDVLEDRLAVLLGLFPRRDGSETAAAARLYADLLSEAVRSLDPRIRRLVVIPDGRLHRLPFAALRDEGEGRWLAQSYEITVAPSITLWMRWKREATERTESPSALILADPLLHVDGAGDGHRSVSPWHDGLQLGPLPGALREARIVARRIGPRSRVLHGAEATESFIKQAALGDVDLLHFASHAVVDDQHPERSAVVLAPGADTEDGLLQIREIVDLDLDGAVVVLTGCRSASGSLIEGEGPLGLARGFFQAGARGVVGSVWELRDDDAEKLVRELVRSLSRGGSLAEAMAEARRARIEAGAPPEAWAGLVVLGDGDLVLMRAGRRGIALGVAAAVLLALLVTAGLIARRRLRNRIASTVRSP